MKFFPRMMAAALLLLCSTDALAGPIGPIEVSTTGVPEYRVDLGGGFFRQGRRLRTGPGSFDVTRNEAYGTLRYTGYDWSVGGRFGVANLDEKPVGAESSEAGRTESFKPMVGIVAKALMVSDPAGDFGLGATFQATRYLYDTYQNYLTVGLAITAQQRWKSLTVYGGPFFSYGSGRRKGGVATDNTGSTKVDYAKETPLVGLCAGFSFALPKSMVFEVEGQSTGIASGNGFSTGLSDWAVGAGLRIPVWY
jgi:hypothetical protein